MSLWPRGAFIFVMLSVLCVGCGTTERRGERVVKTGVVAVTDLSEINLQFERSERFLRGDTDIADTAGEGAAVMYPAPTAGVFAGFVLGHALVGNAINAAEKKERDDAADQVLANIEALAATVEPERIEKELAQALSTDMAVKVYTGTDQASTRPTFMTKPIFALSQNLDFVAIENLVVIESQAGLSSYTNRIHLISKPIDLTALEASKDTDYFLKQLMELYTLTNRVALLDASSQLSEIGSEEATFKVRMGSGYEYHRGRLIRHIEGFGILKTLGGNFLLAPVDQIAI